MVNLQATIFNAQLKLTRVSIKNLKVPLKVVNESGIISLFPTIGAYVNLPDSIGVFVQRHNNEST